MSKEIMIRIKDKVKNAISNPVPISWLIIGGDDLEFPETGETLPLKDLVIYFDEYEIILDE